VDDILPSETDIASRVDLEELGIVDMANLDERCGDEEEVGRVECNAVWSTFPFDCLIVPVGLAVAAVITDPPVMQKRMTYRST